MIILVKLLFCERKFVSLQAKRRKKQKIIIMAIEDDMIEYGYSDAQEYFESLIDDLDYYSRQQEREEKLERERERERELDDDFNPFYNEETKREYYRKLEIEEKQLEKEKKEKEWVAEWKNNNPDQAIIWTQLYDSSSYWHNLVRESYEQLNEYCELKKWLNGRKQFEIERNKSEWIHRRKELFSFYKNELFDFYFPEDEDVIDIYNIDWQVNELSLIKNSEPSLWNTINKSYSIDDSLFEGIEEDAFWREIYNIEMKYDYWMDCKTEQFDLIAKELIANKSFNLFSDWITMHENEKAEWKNKNLGLWEKYKKNFEIREKNKFIESKIKDYKIVQEVGHSIIANFLIKQKILKSKIEDDYEDWFSDDYKDDKAKLFLPDLESAEELLFDLSSLSKEGCQYVQESLKSLDMSKISNEASQYADKVLNQQWLFSNRFSWGLEAMKKCDSNLFKGGDNFYETLLFWWKNKYPSKWNDFVNLVVPKFRNKIRNNIEIVLKFRLWALDGNKEAFLSLAEKYLPNWNKIIKFIYGQDIHNQMCSYFCNEILYKIDFWGEDVDYIKKHTSDAHEIEIWQKELQDRLLWRIFYEGQYEEHFELGSMYITISNSTFSSS